MERNGIRRFVCADCHKTFTRFTGTILEKSRWHWDVWVKVLEMTLNDYSLETMKRVQMDETHLRESQKAARGELVSYIKGEERLPRYGRQPSNYTTVIEKAGYAAAQDETQRTHNRAVLERLYREGLIDRVNHREDLTYTEVDKLKRTYSLSLVRVNELHRR